MLPVGSRDEIGVDTVKIFCPKCQCVYQPPPIRTRSGHHSSNSGGGGAVDGAAFGTTFPHLFLMTFNNLVPDPLPPGSAYIPRVFGFRVHKISRQQNITGGGSAAAYSAAAPSHNGRSGRASAGFSSQRVVNMTSTPAGPAGGDPRTGTPIQEARAGKDAAQEVKADKPTLAAADAGNVAAQQAGDKSKVSNASTPKSAGKKSGGANDDGAADVDGAKEKANADGGDGNSNSSKKRNKSDGGKNSGSSNENGTSKNRSTKRQKRPYNGAEVT